MKQSWKIILVHFILIVFFLSVPILSSPDFDLSFRMFDVKPFQRSFFSYVMVILFFYFHYYLIIPRLFEQKKMVLYWGTIILSFIAIASLLHFSFVNGIPNEHNNFGPPPADFGPDHGMPGPRFVLIENLSFIIPFLLVLLFSHYLRANRRTKQVEFDKVQTELQNLKYQLQPHFLFNSLNNIYSISIIDHKRTPHYILQLFEILRYLLQT